MPERLLDYAEVCRRLKLGRTQVYLMVQRGELPEPMRIGRARRFREADIDAYIATTAAGTDGAKGAAA